MMFKKLTAVFSILRKEKLDERDLEESIRAFKREGALDAFKKTRQDTEEIYEMALVAFDESTKKARERFAGSLRQIMDHIKSKK